MPEEYIVKSGDGLEKIASKYKDVSAEDIVAANDAVDNYYSNIDPGQVLIIPTEEKVEPSEFKSSYEKKSYKNYYEYFEVKRDNTYVKNTYVSCENLLFNVSKRTLKKIRISMFFDGTGNNRANTNYKINNEKGLKGKKRNDYLKAAASVLLATKSLRYSLRTYDSYDNDHSNISRLENYIGNDPSYDFNTSIYVEGIGTTNLEADNTRGMITGRNSFYATSSGIKAKTRKGVKTTIEAIDGYCSKDREKIRLDIDLDVFGFSRGSAAARYFVYLILNSNSTLSDQLRDKGYWISSVKIKFVGLFDTVSSYGALKNSDSSLHLAFTKANMPEKVVHLVAAEEYRKSFPLTNINSAGDKGIEIYLPGCHSDIGGGYNDNAKEKDLQLLDLYLFNGNTKWLEEDKEQLIKLGWYKKGEFKKIDSINKELIASRTVKYKSYSYIPLQLMAQYAIHEGVPIWKDGLFIQYSIPKGLKKLKKEIDKHIALHGSKYNGERTSTHYHWHNNDAEVLTNIRHDYFHFSARYGDSGGALKPRIKGNKRVRRVK